LLPASELRAQFQKAGICCDESLQRSNALTVSCGSGVTACVAALGLYVLGFTQIPVYDGSWVEWGARVDLPIETTAVGVS
jgi:thiosulfate/3-mercaptopyruvate sulfurtransferase